MLGTRPRGARLTPLVARTKARLAPGPLSVPGDEPAAGFRAPCVAKLCAAMFGAAKSLHRAAMEVVAGVTRIACVAVRGEHDLHHMPGLTADDVRARSHSYRIAGAGVTARACTQCRRHRPRRQQHDDRPSHQDRPCLMPADRRHLYPLLPHRDPLLVATSVRLPLAHRSRDSSGGSAVSDGTETSRTCRARSD
jgi:hypothetical protein